MSRLRYWRWGGCTQGQQERNNDLRGLEVVLLPHDRPHVLQGLTLRYVQSLDDFLVLLPVLRHCSAALLTSDQLSQLAQGFMDAGVRFVFGGRNEAKPKIGLEECCQKYEQASERMMCQRRLLGSTLISDGFWNRGIRSRVRRYWEGGSGEGRFVGQPLSACI